MPDIAAELREFGATANPGGRFERLPFAAADEIDQQRTIRAGLADQLKGVCDVNASLEKKIGRLTAALKELADAAEIDLKCNQDYDGEHAPGGWWTLRTENAIRAARAFEQKEDAS